MVEPGEPECRANILIRMDSFKSTGVVSVGPSARVGHAAGQLDQNGAGVPGVIAPVPLTTPTRCRHWISGDQTPERNRIGEGPAIVADSNMASQVAVRLGQADDAFGRT